MLMRRVERLDYYYGGELGGLCALSMRCQERVESVGMKSPWSIGRAGLASGQWAFRSE